ncbi:MAG: hypothetical protein JXP34_10185 [Planctomycetes bacterium]|nr:hypothetical protein [Planctomycetota bacterium]
MWTRSDRAGERHDRLRGGCLALACWIPILLGAAPPDAVQPGSEAPANPAEEGATSADAPEASAIPADTAKGAAMRPDPPRDAVIPVVGGGGGGSARPEAPPLSRLTSSDARSLDFLGLAFAVAREVEGEPPTLDPEALECRIEELAFSVRAAIGNPQDVDHRRTAAALVRHVLEAPPIVVVQMSAREGFDLAQILENRRADPAGAALLILAVAERLFPPTSPHSIPLRPVVLGKAVYLECRDGALVFYLDLANGGRDVTASDLRRLANAPAGSPLSEGLDPARFGSLILCDLARISMKEASAGEAGRARALALYRAALDLDPRQTEPNLALAEDALARGETDLAQGLVAAALAVAPQLPGAISLRARLRLARGETAGARTDLEWLAAHAAAAYPDALLQLADAAMASGDEAAARQALERYRAVGGTGDGLALAESRLRDLDAAPSVSILRTVGDDAARFRAIHRLRSLRAASAASSLVEVLSDPNLRLRYYAWQALRDISGEDLGPSPEAWREWLARREEGGLVPAP